MREGPQSNVTEIVAPYSYAVANALIEAGEAWACFIEDRVGIRYRWRGESGGS